MENGSKVAARDTRPSGDINDVTKIEDSAIAGYAKEGVESVEAFLDSTAGRLQGALEARYNLVDVEYSQNDQDRYDKHTDEIVGKLSEADSAFASMDDAAREVFGKGIAAALYNNDTQESKTAALRDVISLYREAHVVESISPEETESTQEATEPSQIKKLGGFAAKLAGVANVFNKAGAYGYASATAIVGGGVKAAHAAASPYMRAKDRLTYDSEKDSRKMRVAKWLGRNVLLRGGTGLLAAGTLVATKYGYDTAFAAVNHVYVPGTGAAPDHNTVHGATETLGYPAGAGPFVGETPYNVSVNQGVQNLIDTVRGNGNIKTLDGYSQGADVVREAVSKLSPQEQARLVLNLGGDPSGEKGILTLAHNSPQGQLMNMLGFDTSSLKDTGAARVNEIRVSNDLMADASYTFFDANQFNGAVEKGDYVGALRMLANTGEKTGGYLTTHSGALDVLPQDAATYNPAAPGNATVAREMTANGTLTTITPNVTAGEGLLAKYTGVRLTPEARQFYESAMDPNVSNSQVIQNAGDAAKEGINNTTWLPNEAKGAVNTAIDQATDMVDHTFSQPVIPQASTIDTAPQAPIAPVAPAETLPQQIQQPLQQFTQQPAMQNTINQVANEVQKAAPQLSTQINQAKSLFGLK